MGTMQYSKFKSGWRKTCRKRMLIPERCARFGSGERNFKRRFSEATGHPPLSYLQLIRIEQAKRLLERSTLSLEEVTHQVGYEDSNSFRRLFQNRF
ncbi:helix-turn-helix domain-containing protein [Pseudomonas asplenii]|uniref:helix-turn-helix domain-containing protein n=1 Tax=Pseudomonas asplenii TaxID=53407 RepID=UPI003CC7EFA9